MDHIFVLSMVWAWKETLSKFIWLDCVGRLFVGKYFKNNSTQTVLSCSPSTIIIMSCVGLSCFWMHASSADVWKVLGIVCTDFLRLRTWILLNLQSGGGAVVKHCVCMSSYSEEYGVTPQQNCLRGFTLSWLRTHVHLPFGVPVVYDLIF